MNKEKKERFKRLRNALKSQGRATAMKDASKNPKKFEQENKEPSIKNLKGVAF